VTTFVAGACGLFGLLVGSFLNVVIWRVPRKESVVAPRSHCPECDTVIAPRDNVPVASYVALRGRCRHCGTHISARYPVVELITGALFAATGARFHDSWALPAFLLFVAALVAISLIDLEHYIIPNKILYPVGIAAVPLLFLAGVLDDDLGAFARALGGAVVAFVFFLTLHLISPRAMGFGDVRLSFLLGLYLGWLGWDYMLGGLFAGFVYGAVIGLVLMALGKRGRKQHIPFGPFLAAGALTFVLLGEPILDWYHGLGQ
jgi:leader peptidase (prepilin peptidase)/N-methyltransferase